MKAVVSLLVGICTFSSLFAQSFTGVAFSAGVCYANQTWAFKAPSMEFHKYYKAGKFFSIGTELYNTQRINLVCDLGYIEKGSVDKVLMLSGPQSSAAPQTQRFYNHFNYVFINPLLKIKFSKKKLVPFLTMGARLDYMVNWRSNFDLHSLEADMRKLIPGLTGGFGIDYKIKQLTITSGITYYYDLINLVDLTADATSAGLIIKNNAFVACAGLKYNLKKKT